MKTQTKPILVQLPRNRKPSYSLFGSLTALAAGLAFLGGQSSALAQADNFNDGTDTFPTVDWTHVDVINTASGGASVPNTYDASTFQYHLTADASSSTLGLGQARTLSYPADIYTDFYVSVDLVDWAPLTTAQAIGVCGRLSDIGPLTTDGYAFGLLSGGVLAPGASYIRILRIQNESTKDVFGSGPEGDSVMPIPDLDPAKDYRLVFMGHGTDLEGRLYELPNLTTPIAVVKGNTAGDAIILTEGVSGLLAFGAQLGLAVDVTFDNYYASARCPMTITDMVVKDNFNDGNDTAPTVAWQRYDPISQAGVGPQNTWSFPGGNTYRLEAPTQPFNPLLGQGRVASFDPVVQTDFRVAADIVNWDENIDQDFGVFARGASLGLGTTTGYLMSFDYNIGGGGDIDISIITGEDPDGLPLTGEDAFEMVTGKSYRFVFSGKGSELRAMVFELPETMNPVVDMVATDTTYASGQGGLLVAADSDQTIADATFDNWSSTAAPVPAVSVAFGTGPGGEFTVTWPGNIECVWILESTTSLNPVAVWTEVPTTTTAGDAAKLLYDPGTGMNTYTAAAPMATSPNTYYRLKQL